MKNGVDSTRPIIEESTRPCERRGRLRVSRLIEQYGADMRLPELRYLLAADCPRVVADKGRMGWQKASGYNRRARIEATMGRFKGVIGDGLRSRTDQRRATEVEVAVHVLNRMLELGRPESVRIA
jgi:hypothetical protein